MKIAEKQLRRVIREICIHEAEIPDELLGQLVGHLEPEQPGEEAEPGGVTDLLTKSLEDNPDAMADIVGKTLKDNPEAMEDILDDDPGIMQSITGFFEDNPEDVPEEVTAAVEEEGKESVKDVAEELESTLKGVGVGGVAESKRRRQNMRITRRHLSKIIKEVLEEDKSGKGKCPDTGCIKKSGDKWRIISNKTGKMWPQKYKTKKSAENALKAYHVQN